MILGVDLDDPERERYRRVRGEKLDAAGIRHDPRPGSEAGGLTFRPPELDGKWGVWRARYRRLRYRPVAEFEDE